MAEYVSELVHHWHWSVLVAVMALSVFALGKGADWLVAEAVTISFRSGVPSAVVGATVVSLGTTAPEAAVSVLAAIQGKPDVALGNAVGSIICDTGLILGIACLLVPLPINRRIVNRQGWVQFCCGVLLVAACVPWQAPATILDSGGSLPQTAGWTFLGLLAIYLWWSVRLARFAPLEEIGDIPKHSFLLIIGRLIAAIAIVVISSSFLIATATELGERIHVPKSIIAATLVAFGTSLPELVIVVTATLKGESDIAIGNVIGADILNVLFVAGTAAAVTPVGLPVEPPFFKMQFPAMLFVLLVFRIGIWTAKENKLQRPFGVVLLGAYLAVTLLSFFA